MSAVKALPESMPGPRGSWLHASAGRLGDSFRYKTYLAGSPIFKHGLRPFDDIYRNAGFVARVQCGIARRGFGFAGAARAP